MSGLSKDQAFAACEEMQGMFFGLADRSRDPAEKRRLQSYAVKAGQVAGYIIPGLAPANDDDGDAA
jgi:hypothetical protein